jgi:Lrp/AsnC family transcriptional regulator for asnA, asnC and gidA
MKKLFDTKDMEILACLRRDARQPLKSMSKQVGLPISTIYDRIKKLEVNGLIESYTVLINYKKMQHPIKAAIFLKANNGNREKLETAAFESIYTNTLIKLTGDEYNYLLEGVFPSMDALSTFVDKLGAGFNLEKHKVYYVITEIKRESFMKNASDVKLLAASS